jgi:DNA-directed RNA polymerase specialized sigma24 family protein
VRADPDFAAYVVARWLPVVRVLVVLGHPVDRAEDVAVASFARLLPDWGRLRREDDVDVELARVVLDGWVRTRGREHAPQLPVSVPAARVMTQELEDQLALLERLVQGLGELDDATSVAVVLHHLGELDEQQVAEVLGEPRAEVHHRLSDAAAALALQLLDPACHSAAAAIEVSPPSVARVVAHASAGQRRRWLVTGAVVLALVLVAGVSYLVTRNTPAADPAALEISPVENIVDAAWWEDGLLHLHHGTARVPEVTQLVETGVGVVYADGDGVVTAVAEDGTQRELGEMAADTALVAQPRFGWVAWTLPDGGDIVVYDAIGERELGRLDASDDTRLIGWDRERFYFHSEGSDWVANVSGPGLTEPQQVEPPEGFGGSVLIDVSSGSELRSEEGALSVVHPYFSIHPEIPGATGLLSPDGNFVLTRVGDEVALYDARDAHLDGDWDTWVDRGWTTVAATFTVEGRVVWVVDSHDGSFGLYECQASKQYINSMNPDQEPCTQRLDIDGVPLLAGAPQGLDLVK